MQAFYYQRASDSVTALRAAQAQAGQANIAPTSAAAQFIAGGTQMLDLMKLGAMTAGTLVDLNDLQTSNGQIDASSAGLRLGALVRMTQAAEHPDIQRDYPVIAQSLSLAASPQIRNMASLAGNILQRTRCAYFRETSYASCNKRAPGTGCSALDGVNRKHAVLGTGDRCIAAYPGDFAQALIALGAQVHTDAPDGGRTIEFADLHTGPEHPEVETVLRPGELITYLTVPSGPWTRRSLYVKVRDRQSYAFGLATAAVAVHMEGGTVAEARVGLGGVAYRPWRAHEAEDVLKGKQLTEEAAAAASRAAFAGAKPRRDNAYMVALGQRTLTHALLQAGKLEV